MSRFALHMKKDHKKKKVLKKKEKTKLNIEFTREDERKELNDEIIEGKWKTDIIDSESNLDSLLMELKSELLPVVSDKNIKSEISYSWLQFC